MGTYLKISSFPSGELVCLRGWNLEWPGLATLWYHAYSCFLTFPVILLPASPLCPSLPLRHGSNIASFRECSLKHVCFYNRDTGGQDHEVSEILRYLQANSLAQFHGSWQKTGDSWIRGKWLYYSQSSGSQSVGVCSLSPSSYRAMGRRPNVNYWLPYRMGPCPELRKPPLFIMGSKYVSFVPEGDSISSKGCSLCKDMQKLERPMANCLHHRSNWEDCYN